jgi:non-heme chloroperoxidase
MFIGQFKLSWRPHAATRTDSRSEAGRMVRLPTRRPSSGLSMMPECLRREARAGDKPSLVLRPQADAATIATKDGTSIFDNDWGTGTPIVFSHGWPLNSHAGDDQRLFLASKGYRAIAHDRRGHGRSGQPRKRNDMDAYADDLAILLERLEVRNATLVGHSTGGGEVARDIGWHGTKRVGKAALIGAVTPLMPLAAIFIVPVTRLRGVGRLGQPIPDQAVHEHNAPI